MRILWVVPYFYEPANSGGRLRLRHVLDQVLKAGHEVELWVVDDDGLGREDQRPGLKVRRFRGRDKSSALQRALGVFAPLPHWAWVCSTPLLRRTFRTKLRTGVELVVLDELHTGFLTRMNRDVPIVALFTNIESRAQSDLAEITRSRLRRLRLRRDAVKLRRLESEVIRRAETVVVVSEADARSLRERGARTVVVAPNGVAAGSYRGVWRGPPGSAVIVMTANFGYAPNRVGAEWLIHSVMPHVWANLPELELWLVGAGPTAWMRSRSEEDCRLVVTGEVDDVRPFLARASASVVPLLSGGGTSLKVAEALATGMPVVCTSVGARGYDLDGLATVVDDPIQFAEAVVRCVVEPPSPASAEARRRYAAAALDWQVTLHPLISALPKAVRSDWRCPSGE